MAASHSIKRRETVAFYLCISPWIIGFLLFVLGPMLASLWMSFHRWDLLRDPRFIGLANYQRLFREDPLFWQSLRVTLTYTLLYVPTELIGGLVLALLMNQRVRGISIFRTIFYLPSVLAGVAFVVVWMWLLHPEAGLVNAFLGLFGIPGPRWLTDPHTALYALWLMSIWGLGRTAIIYLAGLKDIPLALYEAAAIDGAGQGRSFLSITLPMLTPTIFFNLVLSIISTFQTFTSAFVATNGGPLDSTLFYVLYIYRNAFQTFQMGYASALAWVLFVIILLLTLLVVRSARSWVYYGGGSE
ncbi:MAG: sugar ABC transporter permease [Caldilineaceae bacterium]|nr:sugar ABC transporter permease [Caldilineaceae bacterium]MCB9138321.1 sugar ABC transporter permease [Caldilineaceae bacterium]